MPGEQSNIDLLTQHTDGPFSGKLTLIMAIIRGNDATEKRLLAEWLFARMPKTDDRTTLHVSLLALARVESMLTDDEFGTFVAAVLGFYDEVTESLRDDDPLLAVATYATPCQRVMLPSKLGSSLEGDGVLRDAAMAALILIVASFENADDRAKLATTLQKFARNDELGEIQRAALRKKKA